MGKWLSNTRFLTFEVRDRIAYVTLNRPDKRNAQNVQCLEELNSAMREADDLVAVRCVVLQGAGKDFCAGADIGGMEGASNEPPPYDVAAYRARGDTFENDVWHTRYSSELRLIIANMHKPVIGKLHGNCLAVGTDIALNCDMLVAANDAKIGFPATRALGSPANHMWLYLVGPQWAKRMLMTGDKLSGRDAARIGLVLKAVPADKLDAEVDALAKRVALTDGDLLASHKRIVNLGLELMGWSTLQRLAAENDARAHLSTGFKTFFGNVQDKGLKEALRLRDEPFGQDVISLDDA
jgi:enoyl-CoA hydratase